MLNLTIKGLQMLDNDVIQTKMPVIRQNKLLAKHTPTHKNQP